MKKIDTGQIIDQKEISITPKDTAGSLHDTLMEMGAELVVSTIHKIASGKLTLRDQPKAELEKTAFKLNRNNTKIEWNLGVAEIYNLIRGLNPYPGAWCFLYNKEGEKKQMIKLFAVEKEIINHDKNPGSIIIVDKQLKVAAKDGFINVRKMQLAGKKAMMIKDLLNGFNFTSIAKLC